MKEAESWNRVLSIVIQPLIFLVFRKGIAVNFIWGERDEMIQKQIEEYFGKEIIELKNEDPEQLAEDLKKYTK